MMRQGEREQFVRVIQARAEETQRQIAKSASVGKYIDTILPVPDNVLHARHEIAVYFGNAPHLVLPRLELFFVQATTDGFLSNLLMMGQAHHLIGQQLDRPARPPRRRIRASSGHQQQFLFV